MRLAHSMIFLFVAALLTAVGLAACGGGPEIVGGGEYTVSIKAGGLANVRGLAQKHCQGYGKEAVALGDKSLGPNTTKRLYAYDCVSPVNPHN